MGDSTVDHRPTAAFSVMWKSFDYGAREIRKLC